MTATDSATTSVGAPGTLTWLGHASVLLTSASGTRVIFDPWLENPKVPADLGDLGELDVICVTHGHFDHMASVIPLAIATGATVVCVPEMAAYFASAGLSELAEMNKGGTLRLQDLTFTMVGADHSCGVHGGENAPSIYGGNPVGFVVGLPAGEGGPIYISGDTNVFSDMAIVRDLYAPELGLMPIDGHYNMGPREAAYAINLLGLTRFAPYHYGTFPLLAGTPEELAEHLRAASSPTALVNWQPGESIALSKG
jgi:L-ascorbate metabolism protein UlaG (beta-lactamase superfamily)